MEDDTRISLHKYLREFIPSLRNFCGKSPLQLTCSFVVETGSVRLSSKHLKEDIVFVVDPFKDKKVLIKDIKTKIEKDYPIIFNKVQFPLSDSEKEKLLAEGKDIREVLDLRIEKYIPFYKIIRIHNEFNEIDLFDFKLHKVLKFKVLIPLVSFMNKIYSLPKEASGEFFNTYTFLKEEIVN